MGDDYINGGKGNDLIFGGMGEDTIVGGTGNDIIFGNAGADIVDGGTGGDTIYGEEGDDILDGGEGGDFLSGDEGDDTLEGGAGDDHIEGGEGDDTVDGGEGNDLILGDAGDDHLEGGAGADSIDGGEGTDYADYRNAEVGVRVNLALETGQVDFDGSHGFAANCNEAVGDTLSNVEVVEGSEHNDWLTGDDNANWLVGNGGNDRLEGGGGQDTLYGLDGDDTLLGGAGTDSYFFRFADGSDTIDDVASEGDDVMFLIFRDFYEAEDFASSIFERVVDDLVISLDKQPDDGIEDKITIKNAYDNDASTGTGNAAFTISISYGTDDGSSPSSSVTDIWSNLVA